jgi:hypothetical protein
VRSALFGHEHSSWVAATAVDSITASRHDVLTWEFAVRARHHGDRVLAVLVDADVGRPGWRPVRYPDVSDVDAGRLHPNELRDIQPHRARLQLDTTRIPKHPLHPVCLRIGYTDNVAHRQLARDDLLYRHTASLLGFGH